MSASPRIFFRCDNADGNLDGAGPASPWGVTKSGAFGKRIYRECTEFWHEDISVSEP